MTDHTNLLEQAFELNLNNYGPEDVERLNDWAITAYAALGALQAEVVRLRVIAKEASEYATKHQTEVLRLQAQLAAAQGQDLLEIMCARIKAADDAMADGNYMLDSDDCISVIRGTWKPPMLNDKPAAPTPQAAAQPPAPSGTAITYMTGYSDGREWAGATNQAQPSQALGLTDERQPWAPYLSNRADGVKGHYAIARWNPKGYREVWNLHSHRWSSASEDVLSLESAEYLLRQIVIPTRSAGLSDSEVWANNEIMALNAEAGLAMPLLMKIVRAVTAAINAKEQT